METLAIVIIGIGVLAILWSVLTHFTSLTDTRVDIRSTVPIKFNTPEFLTALENITKSPPIFINEDDMMVLNNGEEFLPALLDDIKNAKHSITATNYIWKEGKLMSAIFNALTERAKEGIEIRILMDGKGNFNAPDEKIKILEKAGGKIATFRPLNFRTLTRINKRTHVRAIVIDGSIGYVGGAAFEDGWLGDGTGKKRWRDMMFRLEGVGARSIQHMFNDLWRQTKGEILSGPLFYPELAEVKSKASYIFPLLHTPSPDLEKDLSQFLWISIMAAEKTIRMETPYLLPDENILDALKDKARSGVDVQIMVPGPYVDSKMVRAASRTFYEEILDAGIKLFEYQPAGFHSKALMADSHWAIIGSANLDNRSSTLNVEGIIGVENKKLLKDMEEGFELNKTRAKTITKATVRRRNKFTSKILCQISLLFSKQY